MAKKMNTGVKVAIGVALVAGAGVAGYYGYKKYKESKDAKVSGLGAFTDGGYADYNARVAHAYWTRMHQKYSERLQLQAMGAR